MAKKLDLLLEGPITREELLKKISEHLHKDRPVEQLEDGDSLTITVNSKTQPPPPIHQK